jgi:hypothetical protein
MKIVTQGKWIDVNAENARRMLDHNERELCLMNLTSDEYKAIKCLTSAYSLCCIERSTGRVVIPLSRRNRHRLKKGIQTREPTSQIQSPTSDRSIPHRKGRPSGIVGMVSWIAKRATFCCPSRPRWLGGSVMRSSCGDSLENVIAHQSLTRRRTSMTGYGLKS